MNTRECPKEAELYQPQESMGPDLQGHVATCEDCRRAHRVWSSMRMLASERRSDPNSSASITRILVRAALERESDARARVARVMGLAAALLILLWAIAASLGAGSKIGGGVVPGTALGFALLTILWPVRRYGSYQSK